MVCWGRENHGSMRNQERKNDQKRTKNYKRKERNHKKRKRNHKRRKRNYRGKKRNHRRKRVYYRAGNKSEGCIVILCFFYCLLLNFFPFCIALDPLLLYLNLSHFLFWNFIVVIFIDAFVGNIVFIIITPVQIGTPSINCTISIVLNFRRPFIKEFGQLIYMQIIVGIGVVIEVVIFSSSWSISFFQLLVV